MLTCYSGYDSGETQLKSEEGLWGLVVEDNSTRLAMGVARECVSDDNILSTSEIKLNVFALLVLSFKCRREPAVGVWGNGTIALEGYKRTEATELASKGDLVDNLLEETRGSTGGSGGGVGAGGIG
ncbi:hypothetical protein BC835DRAFT_1306478 [Cytidiella melzeri]|nr:hypothetical protein BC835DRAFT_1306478 [Cytidiella melzeri]